MFNLDSDIFHLNCQIREVLMMLYGSGWNCFPFWGTVLDIYKTLSCKSLFQKKKKIPTYLPTSKMMGRSTANIQFFKDGPAAVIILNEIT